MYTNSRQSAKYTRGFGHLLLVVVIAVIAIGVGYYFYSKSNGTVLTSIDSTSQLAAVGGLNIPGNVYAANDYSSCIPTNICNSTTEGLTVSWTYTQGTENISSFWIIRTTNGGAPAVIAKVVGTRVPGSSSNWFYYTDKTAVSGNSYTYSIKAVGVNGSSASSLSASPAVQVYAQTSSPLLTPTASFKATYNGTDVFLTQTTTYSLSAYLSGIQVYRKTGSGSYTLISPHFNLNPLNSLVTSMNDTDPLVSGTTYTYVVRYYSKPFNYSGFSTPVSIKIP